MTEKATHLQIGLESRTLVIIRIGEDAIDDLQQQCSTLVARLRALQNQSLVEQQPEIIPHTETSTKLDEGTEKRVLES